MLEVAARKIRKQGLKDKISLVVGDLNRLPFQDYSFNTILCLTDTFSLNENPSNLLLEVRRILKTKSLAFVDFTNRLGFRITHWRNIYNAKSIRMLVDNLDKPELFDVSRSKEGTEIKWKAYFIDEATELFKNNDFEVEKIIGKPVLLHWRFPLLTDSGATLKEDISLSSEMIDAIKKLELRLCDETTLLGICGKFMIIARKQNDMKRS